ncbi:unnamed protein product [Rangifer tarandus platyrhynchus]|uniref:Uncharacterized protein n=1 Tax=Rangifer tarandus platyrhynchus TaxID=3082113 RepID=A0ABN8XIC8_RANTA|nr:unnamed protein product [Rangifer tarandus platyrhynchus]
MAPVRVCFRVVSHVWRRLQVISTAVREELPDCPPYTQRLLEFAFVYCHVSGDVYWSFVLRFGLLRSLFRAAFPEYDVLLHANRRGPGLTVSVREAQRYPLEGPAASPRHRICCQGPTDCDFSFTLQCRSSSQASGCSIFFPEFPRTGSGSIAKVHCAVWAGPLNEVGLETEAAATQSTRLCGVQPPRDPAPLAKDTCSEVAATLDAAAECGATGQEVREPAAARGPKMSGCRETSQGAERLTEGAADYAEVFALSERVHQIASPSRSTGNSGRRRSSSSGWKDCDPSNDVDA